MKKAGLLLLAALCALTMASCKDDDKDDFGKAQSISGAATLRVVNEVRYTQKIRFDGTYIGDVAANSSRDWNVPTGFRTVTAYDSVTGSASQSANFQAGRVTVIRFFMQGGRHAAPLPFEDKEAAVVE